MCNFSNFDQMKNTDIWEKAKARDISTVELLISELVETGISKNSDMRTRTKIAIIYRSIIHQITQTCTIIYSSAVCMYRVTQKYGPMGHYNGPMGPYFFC